jgi:general secretion pathway protein A
MYWEKHGLTTNPFRNAPGSTFFYSSLNHRHILERILRGFREHVGPQLLLGENGIGKTTLCRYLLGAHGREFNLVYLGNPFVSETEFLAHLAGGLGLETAAGDRPKGLVDRLTDHLSAELQQGRVSVFMVDEAHHLSDDLLSQVLVLSNLQADGVPLVQLFISGLPGFSEVLDKPQMLSLSQRIGARSHIRRFSREETREYVLERLARAGCHSSLFAAPAMAEVHRAAAGVPRLINHACRLTLEAAQTADADIDAGLVRRVTSDPLYAKLFHPPGPDKRPGRGSRQGDRRLTGGGLRRGARLVTAGLAAVLLAGLVLWPGRPGPDPAPEQTPARAPGTGAAPPKTWSGTGTPDPAEVGDRLARMDPASDPGPAATAGRDVAGTGGGIVRGSAGDPAADTDRERNGPGDVADAPGGRPPGASTASTASTGASRGVPVSEADPAAGLRPSAEFADVKVQAVAWSPDPARRMAVLGDRILHHGDLFRGARVLDISTERIVLVKSGRRHLIPIRRP